MSAQLLEWGIFIGIVLVLLVLDLGVLHRKQREIGVRESLKLSLFYVVIACLFGAWVWHAHGDEAGRDYFTGYLLEKSLSMDNLFVMSLIFSYFAIPRPLQHRVLFWGILGVILLRGLMIGLGVALIERFEWVLLLFAAFLMFTGIKMLFSKDDDDAPKNFDDNWLLKFLRTRLRVTNELYGQRFFVKLPSAAGKNILHATPLFLALILIEVADVIFAVDSVPAIFAITTDPYVIFTSNIFAILGLRALYFALAAILHRFTYLKYALALVLVFIGGKVFAAELLGIEKVPAVISLGVTVTLLAGGMVFSLLKTSKKQAD
jgi:tellurite resistance protein TerC